MKLLMISGDRSVAAGKAGAFSETLKELHTHFERIDIICPRVQNQQVRVVLGNVYIHPSSGGLFTQSSFIVQKGRELFAAQKHDVMTVHDFPPFYNGSGARRLQKVIKIPVIEEIHHIVGWPKASSLQELVGRFLSKTKIPSLVKSFSAVRVVNSTVKKLLIDWGVPTEKIFIIPSFYLDHSLIASSKNQQKTYDLVFSGRLVDNKGLKQVIDALEFLPNATLLVIGDGPLRASMEKRAQKYGKRVTFVGWLPTSADVLKAMASGKIFVMNSTSEGGPRVAIEAMALGLPLLATGVGVMPDVLRDGQNGFFTDGSAKDIAEKARTLLETPSRLESMGVEASHIVHTFEKISAVTRYADFLKSQVH